jgi:hypothetical protein
MEWDDQLMDELLRKSAATLEENYPAGLSPAAEIWAFVEAKRHRSRIVRLRRWSAAAAILLLATVITIWGVVKKENNLPVSRHQLQPVQVPATEKEAMAYINQLCMGDNIACHSSAFKELQSELDATSSELTAINQQIILFGNDEQLLRARSRIENHQARIVKAMLQIL